MGFVTILILQNRNNKNKEVQHFCEVMCFYNPNKYIWEFSTNSIDRSFPTKDGCFIFCKTYKKDFNL